MRQSWPAWGDEPEPTPPHRPGTASLLWLQLRRLGPTRTATPTDDQEGQLRYDRNGSVAGSLALATRNAAGVTSWEQLNNRLASFESAQWRQLLVNPGATTVTNLGFAAAPTLTAVLSNGDDADGTMLIHTTGNVSGDASGMKTAYTVTQRQWNPVLVGRIKTQASISQLRLWFGLTDGDLSASATPTARYAAFRYETTVDSTTFWRCCTDANTGTPTVTTTGVHITAATSYLLRIELDTEARFYIDNVLVARHTSNIPSASTGLGVELDVTTKTGTTKAIGWGRIALGGK